jgi:hypothetical protein
MLNASSDTPNLHPNGAGLKVAFRPPRRHSVARKSLENGAAMEKSLVVSEPESKGTIPEEAIRSELSRILESSIFAQSDRLGRFLRFTIEATLAGEAEMLKEYLIGTEVYDRKPPYHPSSDSIVRSEARRLRSKLKEYYESLGKDDPVFIYYRLGSYVPVFRTRPGQEGDRMVMGATPGELFTERLVAQALAVPSVARLIDVQIVFEGTVRVLRTGSLTPTDFRAGQNGSKRNQIRKVFSKSLRESNRR